MNLRQLQLFVGIYEDGSFNRAAERMHATQSGLSMQIRNLEERLGVRLFERSARGVTPTFAGNRLYTRAVEILRQLDSAEGELRNLSGSVSGPLRVGLMPTFTRGLVAPVLTEYVREHPHVEVTIVEAYSASLTEKVANGEVDFAVVPDTAQPDQIRSRHLGTDREILVRRADGRLPHLEPIPFSALSEFRLVLPARGNARRDAFDDLFHAQGLQVPAVIAMDAMIATLEFVANSEWATILPATICGSDLNGKWRTLHPIVDPAPTVRYTVIEPAKKALSPAAAVFLERLEQEYRKSDEAWKERLLQGYREK